MPVIPTNPRHLLRAILRECTYLPDPRATAYFHRYAISRFRHYQDGKNISLPKRTQLLRSGRKGLSILRRANQGYLGPLQKVLFSTYGRIGRRRRQLMAQLMTPKGQDDPAAVGILGLAPKYVKGWKPPAIIMSLLHSQKTSQGQFSGGVRGGRIKNLSSSPGIPKTNIWGHPMPLKRVKNMTQRWYAKVTDALLPPLPKHEWETLQALASGQMRWEGPKPRRIAARSAKSQGMLNTHTLVDGPPKGETFSQVREGRPHEINARFMRKRWDLVFQHTSFMFWNEKRNRFEFRWGKFKTTTQFKVASPLDADIFFAKPIEQSSVKLDMNEAAG